QLGKPDEAITAYRHGAVLHPENADLLINYAQLLLKANRMAEAFPILQKVCALQPGHAMGWLRLAQACYPIGLHHEGLSAAQKAQELAESLRDKVAALNMLAIHRRELGQVREAVRDCEAAIALDPTDIANHTNRLLFMLADPQAQAQQLTVAAREFAAVFEPALIPKWPNHAARREGGPWRRLRVGFLSPDFRTHAVMYFIEGMLAQLDRREFEIWAFYLYPNEDSATERVRCHADHFVKLALRSPDEQAQAIQEAQIDILIDLAGHTGSNGLLAMALKPAPVQLSCIGYPGTTGLAAIDWQLCDRITLPPGVESLYTERLYPMPTDGAACYRPHSRNPLWRYQPAYQIRPAPALSKGFVTFGSCNNLGKLTDEVLALWGRILRTVPNSRLLIEGKNFDRPAFAAEYRARCTRLGIDGTRLELVPLNNANQYLTYHRIDIALDPFPLVGGTTTFDVLWMGVPLITMNGDSMRSRMGLGILAHLGRHEWIARNADEYVAIAARLANDVQALNEIRQQLRDEFESSVLMREDVFMLTFGLTLRRLWMHWLLESEHPEWSREQVNTQIEAWCNDPPDLPELEFHVGVAPGKRIPLSSAYENLQKILERAKGGSQSQRPLEPSQELSSKQWHEATILAERILCARPHDAVALTALAEIERAHGNEAFAHVYLKEALKSLSKIPEAPDLLLERTTHNVQMAFDYLDQVTERA
ncbi:hypothetical protein P3G55_21745, partial [Leptospira sp. 96542]|nr:hypothetical protein [Leptospira sp. 96542]